MEGNRDESERTNWSGGSGGVGYKGGVWRGWGHRSIKTLRLGQACRQILRHLTTEPCQGHVLQRARRTYSVSLSLSLYIKEMYPKIIIIINIYMYTNVKV